MNEALRAEATFQLMQIARQHCRNYPDYNLAINLNGMNNCIDVKVFKDNECVLSLMEPEGRLLDMLDVAVTHMQADVAPLINWYEYGSCRACAAVMGAACYTNGKPGAPHMHRVRFRVLDA